MPINAAMVTMKVVPLQIPCPPVGGVTSTSGKQTLACVHEDDDGKHPPKKPTGRGSPKKAAGRSKRKS